MNYFTDAQLYEMAIEHGVLELYMDYPEKFKALMNLAVSTAIGEPVAYVSHSFVEVYKNGCKVSMTKDLYYPLTMPLYTVKEIS